MRNLLKVSGLALAMLSPAAHAIPFEIDNGASFLFSEFYVTDQGDSVGAEYAGYGNVSIVRNSDTTSAFQSSALAEMTFEFGGYEVTDVAGIITELDGGWLNLFYDTTPDFNPGTGTGYGDGSLFLALEGHDVTGDSGIISLAFASILGLDVGGGFFDVVGGAAASIFNTNSVLDSDGFYTDMDFTFSSSTLNADLLHADASGTADLRGYAVPEPSTMLMILLAWGIAFRKELFSPSFLSGKRDRLGLAAA